MFEDGFFWRYLRSMAFHTRSQQIYWITIIFSEGINQHTIRGNPMDKSFHGPGAFPYNHNINAGASIFDRYRKRGRVQMII